LGDCSSSDSATEGSESGAPRGGRVPSNGTWDTLARLDTSAIPVIDPLLSRSATGGTRGGVWCGGTVGGRPLDIGAGAGTEAGMERDGEVGVGRGREAGRAVEVGGICGT
jgi:hypothetical protein